MSIEDEPCGSAHLDEAAGNPIVGWASAHQRINAASHGLAQKESSEMMDPMDLMDPTGLRGLTSLMGQGPSYGKTWLAPLSAAEIA